MRLTRLSTRLALAVAALAAGPTAAQDVLPNLEYALVDGQRLRLDLFRPAPAATPPAVVLWVHGGGWCAGARTPLPADVAPLQADGLAIAAVSYRLTSTTPDCANANGATWPAQIHDLKAAVRWLRANAATLGIDGMRIGAWGQSAGAHLATTVALSGGSADLEGSVGPHPGVDSRVAAVVAYYPPTDLLNLGPDFATPPTNRPDLVAVVDGPGQPHARMLAFGGAGEGMGVLRANAANPDPPWPARLALAQSASPLTHVDVADPPVFLLHGTADLTVPLAQSRRLRDALSLAGVATTYREISGLGHVPPGGAAAAEARTWIRQQLEPAALFGDGFEPASAAR
ncbi:MAG: alpha/beta hydrolase [Xanthomonadaceae bacterium]|jgi:acetyl esterase/lipase|nr:alpha/beta hydrolase [Xanthomonadaceae bacterium]